MSRFSFDTVLVALNVADVHRASFIHTVLPEAVQQNMGVIGMKVCAQGALLDTVNMDEAIGYVLSLPGVTHTIIGCRTEAEVDDNARIVRHFKTFDDTQMRQLEARTKSEHLNFAYYKK
jgi:aryl-alcohol dehydrogenase-like predicted oxidoreductase